MCNNAYYNAIQFFCVFASDHIICLSERVSRKMKSIVMSSFARRHLKWFGSPKFGCFDTRSLSALTENLKHTNNNDKNFFLMMALFVGIAAVSVYI